jgi:uncharacterized protein YdaU (DUF1376 family)
MKAPAFQFYAADYLADEKVGIMTLEQEGAYIRLLCYCWREGSIPADPEVLSRLCKGASTTILGLVVSCFKQHPADPSRLIHWRLETERAKQEAWRQKSSEGGKKSSGGRSGGKTPQKPNQSAAMDQPAANHQSTTVTRVVEAIGNTSSSSSSSSSKGGGGLPSDSPPAAPSVSQPVDKEGPPSGLSPVQYALGVIEGCNIPHSFGMREAAASAIEAYAKEHKLKMHIAAGEMADLVSAALAKGGVISDYWFKNGKYRLVRREAEKRKSAPRTPDRPVHEFTSTAISLEQIQAAARATASKGVM